MLVNMKEILAVANQHNFAVPAFNTSSNMILRGVIEESVALHAPAIIAIHPDELSFVGDRLLRQLSMRQTRHRFRYVFIWITAGLMKTV